MKKLIIAIAFAVLSTATFAQTKTTTTTTTTTTKTTQAKLHCYFMKEGAMKECWGTKPAPMAKDAKLKNGTVVTTKGEVVMKDGKKTSLKNGECILAENGKIGTFDQMHPNHKEKM